MIIYIDKSIGIYWEHSGFNESENLFFSELAIAHQKGACFLCGDLSSIETMIKAFEGFEKSIFNQIRNKHSEMKSIIEKVESLIVLSCDSNPNVPVFIEGKYRLINLNETANYNFDNQCTLIGENLNDCKFYKLLAERYLHSQGLKGIKLSLHNELGGGNTIDTVFKKCVEEDRNLTLCIVDSDMKHDRTKKYPNHPKFGDTAIRLIKCHDKLKKSYNSCSFEIFCLDVHEIENLIPIEILKIIAESKYPAIEDGVQYLEKLFNAGLYNAILCYDFKNGGAKITEGPSKTFWDEIGEKVSDSSFPALNDKLLMATLDIFDDPSMPQYKITTFSIEKYLENLWNDIGLKVFSWGCANRPIRA